MFLRSLATTAVFANSLAESARSSGGQFLGPTGSQASSAAWSAGSSGGSAELLSASLASCAGVSSAASLRRRFATGSASASSRGRLAADPATKASVLILREHGFARQVRHRLGVAARLSSNFPCARHVLVTAWAPTSGKYRAKPLVRTHDMPRLRHKLPSVRVWETHCAAIHANPRKLRFQVGKGRPPRPARGRLFQHYLAPPFCVQRAQQPAQVLLNASVAPLLRRKVGRLSGVSLVFWLRRVVAKGRRPDHSGTGLPEGFVKLLCPRARDQVKAVPPTTYTDEPNRQLQASCWRVCCLVDNTPPQGPPVRSPAPLPTP